MSSVPVSILIITYNEEANIRPALDSVVSWADEVFVVDSFSTDRTVEICEEYADRGVKVLQHEFKDYSAQRNWALENAPWSNEWLFWIDADERVTPELADELRRLLQAPDSMEDFYYVKRRFIFLGRWLKHSSSYPLWLIRLFRVNEARFTRPINEQIVIKGEPGYLEHDLLHEDQKGISAWLTKHNRYSSMEAEEYLKILRGGGADEQFLASGDRPDVKRQKRLRRFVHLPCRPLIIFMYLYVWRRGFLDGRPGFVYCFLKAINQYHISCKMYEFEVMRGDRPQKQGRPFNLRLFLKKVVEHLPHCLSRTLVAVPFELRLGMEYTRSRESIAAYNGLQAEERRAFILDHIRQIVKHAYAHVEFYRNFYNEHGFSPDQLRAFEDIQRIPIVTRGELQSVALEFRSHKEAGRILVNTGGTSGQPLDLYIDRNAFAREWAHMHRIWEAVDYEKSDLKLTFRGKNLGRKPLRYNGIHHEYLVSAYSTPADVIDALRGIMDGEPIKFIHGYPSAIYDFVEYCSVRAPDVVDNLRSSLKGVLLASEYPAPKYRDVIDEVLEARSVSWYGHTEMAVLARESIGAPYVFHPMQTYGFCEAVSGSKTGDRLVGTSYYNTATPFIRYDTGDIVTPVSSEGGILESFRVSHGREGDFVRDRQGHNISLTALLFGRHHDAFSDLKFVQAHQPKDGDLVLLVVPKKEGLLDVGDVVAGFDFSNTDLHVTAQILQEPLLLPGGKLPLLVKNLPADCLVEGVERWNR